MWPLNARRLSRKTVTDCKRCNVVRPKVPIMADLPASRVDILHCPFHCTSVDYFGPMIAKRGRTAVKGWGRLFTCLATRAVHLELADSLETDDFILVLRNFIGRRCRPGKLFRDNGRSFVGADKELREFIENLDHTKSQNFVCAEGIQWHFNPPYAPHVGSAWEILVKSVNTALRSVLKETYVTESVLRTALIEVEAVLNSRPLTQNSTDPDAYVAHTPNHFLHSHRDVGLPLPDVCLDNEINSHRWWRQAQVLADHVCRRWLNEYLPALTVRQKWLRDQITVNKNDLVLLVEKNRPRGHWELGRVVETIPGDDSKVRTVLVRTSTNVYTRPVVKICILEEHVKP